MKIVSHSVRLFHATQNPEQVIEQAGRLCWKSEDKITETSHVAFIKMLMEPGRKHESVLEHASAGFIITTDRGISHELVRHRIASYSQSSTRYCNYGSGKFGNEITVVQPWELSNTSPGYTPWKAACLEAELGYLQMLADGEKPQIARSVLPTCLMTEVAMSANLREWRHFLSLRLSKAAHPDMRVVARLIAAELRLIAPTVIEDFSNF